MLAYIGRNQTSDCMLNLMHTVLLVRLGFFRELMGHEGIMEPLHTVNHGGFGPKVIEQTSDEVNKYLKWVWGCLCHERSEYTTGMIHAGLQTTCARAALHIQIVQWPRIGSNKQGPLNVNSTGRLHPKATWLQFQAEAECNYVPFIYLKTVGFEQMISLACCFSFQAVLFILAQPGNHNMKLLKNCGKCDIAGDALPGK